MGIRLAPWVGETTTGIWVITTVTFLTARWLLHPTTHLAVLVLGDANKRREGEKAKTHLRSYHWRGQEGTTRPHPAWPCHAVRSTCDILAVLTTTSFSVTRGRIKTSLASHQRERTWNLGRCETVRKDVFQKYFLILTNIYRPLNVGKKLDQLLGEPWTERTLSKAFF